MHILIAAMPFSGHVLPLLGVAHALVNRGHSVTFYTGAAFQTHVKSAGATWLPFNHAPDFDQKDPDPAFPKMRSGDGLLAMLSSFEHIFFGSAAGQTQDIMVLNSTHPVDAMVADATCIGPGLVSELAGIPCASFTASPTGLGMGRLCTTAADLTVNRAFRHFHNTARAEVGLPPTRQLGLEGTWSNQLVSAQGVPTLEGLESGQGQVLHFIGDAARGARSFGRAHADPDSGGLPANNSPLIHVSQGTLGRDDFPLGQRVVQALADSDCRIVVSGLKDGGEGKPSAAPSAGGGSVQYVNWVDQDLMFERADLFVSNGGYGAVLAALGHGVPVLVVPGAQDKPMVAATVARAGVGRRIHQRRATIGRIGATVRSMLADDGLQALHR